MADFSIKVPGATTRVKLPLQLDIPLARKVKAELGWDLLRPSESPPGLQFPLIQVLHRDLEAWANVLHMLCAKRLQELGLTDDEFLVSLDSQAVSEARQGFWDMWHDFFFQAQAYDVASEVRKQLEILKLGADRVNAIDASRFIDPLDQAIDAGIKALTTTPLSQPVAPGN